MEETYSYQYPAIPAVIATHKKMTTTYVDFVQIAKMMCPALQLKEKQYYVPAICSHNTLTIKFKKFNIYTKQFILIVDGTMALQEFVHSRHYEDIVFIEFFDICD